MSGASHNILKVDRSTPMEDFGRLYEIYETSDHEAIPILSKIKEMQAVLREVLLRSDLKELGVVLSVEGTWGSGKTTFMNLALAEIANENVVIIKYDSLFYGNVSEATGIFIDNIFRTVRDTFGVELRDTGIAENISPSFELSNGLPRFNLNFNFDKTRRPTELIKDKLADSLRKINGKVIIVIDDLDRVSGDDVVHFLRIVRVLRELPNFVVILPVDKGALEDLLAGSRIASPRKYLEKIIDWSIAVDPEISTTRTLFEKKVINSIEGAVDHSSIEELWRMVLLELALNTLDTEEIRNTGVNIGQGKSDQTAQQYERKARSQTAGGESLMRAFINRTNTQYGNGYNLVTKVVNDTVGDRRYFRSYTTLYNGQNFVDFLRGQTSPSLSGAEHLEDQTQSLIKTQWWRDTDYLTSLNSGSQNQEYEINYSQPGLDAESINSQLNNTAISLWDELRNIVESYYPYDGLRHLAPRSINKIITAFNMNALAPILVQPVHDDKEKQMDMYVQVRYAIDKALKET